MKAERLHAPVTMSVVRGRMLVRRHASALFGRGDVAGYQTALVVTILRNIITLFALLPDDNAYTAHVSYCRVLFRTTHSHDYDLTSRIGKCVRFDLKAHRGHPTDSGVSQTLSIPCPRGDCAPAP
ncbi:hypothetical protein EVAR_94082_1 [Eumeta japonica]|uniref:Uncharacterized protein n=1 Tax=Eumeta variegata TaxID=151549 RepID=A0A4C1V614_EUMVA|nr:hypothetical protein EVAR_94082_1 [Eumeta japonica]